MILLIARAVLALGAGAGLFFFFRFWYRFNKCCAEGDRDSANGCLVGGVVAFVTAVVCMVVLAVNLALVGGQEPMYYDSPPPGWEPPARLCETGPERTLVLEFGQDAEEKNFPDRYPKTESLAYEDRVGGSGRTRDGSDGIRLDAASS